MVCFTEHTGNLGTCPPSLDLLDKSDGRRRTVWPTSNECNAWSLWLAGTLHALYELLDGHKERTKVALAIERVAVLRREMLPSVDHWYRRDLHDDDR